MSTADLPAVNAGLNALCTILLATGYALIRTGRRRAHQWVMLTAFGVSTLFLASYVLYHALHGSTRFEGHGFVRGVYFTILISHVLLAVAVVPLAILTLRRALKGWFGPHKRLARWTLPIWFYVSVTGVVVYWMLYQWG